jgi:capsular polysaccharide biosynthesis protein
MAPHFRTIPLTAETIIHQIRSPSFYMTYPELTLLVGTPSQMSPLMTNTWSIPRFPARTIDFHRLENVYIASEGLVFDSSLNLFAETLTQHSEADVEQARAQILDLSSPTILETLRGPSVLCKKRGASNYGHWLIEMMPKAFLARHSLSLPDVDYLVPDAEGRLGSVIAESLALLGIDNHRIIAINAEPRFAKSLIVINGVTHHGNYMSPIVFDAIEALQEHIVAKENRKIFVQRGPTMSRRFEESGAIETWFKNHDFIVLDTAERSLSDQIGHFKGARQVAGIMGAALTNIAFCPPATEIFNFAPFSMPDTFFWFLSGLKRLKYNEIRCPQTGPSRGPTSWDTDIDVSVAEIDRIIGCNRRCASRHE